MGNSEGKYDDIKSDISNKFIPKINIAIDFGTDGTGISYSFPNGNDVYIYGKWKVLNDKKRTIRTCKARTAILLDKYGDFEAFGVNALRGYHLIYFHFI